MTSDDKDLRLESTDVTLFQEVSIWVILPPKEHLARSGAIVWVFVFPLNSYVEILAPSMMVLESRTFGRCFSPKGGAPMNGIRPQRTYWCLPPCEDPGIKCWL